MVAIVKSNIQLGKGMSQKGVTGHVKRSNSAKKRLQLLKNKELHLDLFLDLRSRYGIKKFLNAMV